MVQGLRESKLRLEVNFGKTNEALGASDKWFLHGVQVGPEFLLATAAPQIPSVPPCKRDDNAGNPFVWMLLFLYETEEKRRRGFLPLLCEKEKNKPNRNETKHLGPSIAAAPIFTYFSSSGDAAPVVEQRGFLPYRTKAIGHVGNERKW